MVALPERPEQGMAEKIYQAVEKVKKRKLVLTRLGASGIGKECLRRVFFDWRAYGKREVDGKAHLIFETGDSYEVRIISNLRLIGLGVWDHDENGKQFQWVHESGHFIVKLDGVVKNVLGAEKTPHALEIKSMNDKNFSKLNKEGIKKAQPEHYIQIQMGMHGMKLDRGLYVVVNKNTDEYYFERVHLDKDCVNAVLERIDNLVGATLTPAGISITANAPGCTFCPHKAVCVGKEAPLRNCRTCRNSRPFDDGQWLCDFHNEILSYDKQLKGCENYDPRLEAMSGTSYLQSG